MESVPSCVVLTIAELRATWNIWRGSHCADVRLQRGQIPDKVPKLSGEYHMLDKAVAQMHLIRTKLSKT